MSNIPALDFTQATPETEGVLDAVHASLGGTPNMFRVAAKSPAGLHRSCRRAASWPGETSTPKPASRSHLRSPRQTVATTAFGRFTTLGKSAGLRDADITKARTGDASDSRLDAMISLAAASVRTRGQITAETFSQAKAAGITDAEVVEIVGEVALNMFTNYLNIVAKTEIDSPIFRATELTPA